MSHGGGPRRGRRRRGLPLYRYLGGAGAKHLPVPMMNILNGGKHADNTVDFQEFMIQPWGFDDFHEALRAGVEIYHALKNVLHEQGPVHRRGRRGRLRARTSRTTRTPWASSPGPSRRPATGSASRSSSRSIPPPANCRTRPKKGRDGYCFFKSDPDRICERDEMIDLWAGWCAKYPIRSIEDGLAENDWGGWEKLTDGSATRVQLVGDDIFVTNPKFLQTRHR